MAISQNNEKKIIQLQAQHKKLLENNKKILFSSMKDINKELPKYRKGLNQLLELEEEKMSIGVDGVAKKRKSLLKSVRALGSFVRISKSELETRLPEEKINLDEVKLWQYEDFKEWLRNFSKMINHIEKEKSNSDRIMGLDFALKKRVATNPFDKIRQSRNVLRDLFQNDFTVNKIIEDLNKLQIEIQELEELLSSKNQKLRELNKLIEDKNSNINSIQKEYEKSENEGEIKKFRDAKINFKEVELEIGHLVNPFKKIFRQYSRMEGNQSYILSIARTYEDNTIHTFLDDSENEFKELKDLMNELVNNAEKIDLKANLKNRCKQLINRIEKGKIKQIYLDYRDLADKIAIFSENAKVVSALEDLDKLKEEIDNLNDAKTTLESEVEKITTEINDALDQLKEREKRFNDSFDEGKEIGIEK